MSNFFNFIQFQDAHLFLERNLYTYSLRIARRIYFYKECMYVK
nr:MAG TPA: hypothetical protein [Caudoviricetes sp.]DAS04201.1 MAG TPA: hypothetical protein [Caudoviricetes sp.]